MKPKKIDTQGRLFETPLEEIINMEHPLVILSHRIDWASLEETFGKLYVPHHGTHVPHTINLSPHYVLSVFLK